MELRSDEYARRTLRIGTKGMGWARCRNQECCGSSAGCSNQRYNQVSFHWPQSTPCGMTMDGQLVRTESKNGSNFPRILADYVRHPGRKAGNSVGGQSHRLIQSKTKTAPVSLEDTGGRFLRGTLHQSQHDPALIISNLLSDFVPKSEQGVWEALFRNEPAFIDWPCIARFCMLLPRVSQQEMRADLVRGLGKRKRVRCSREKGP